MSKSDLEALVTPRIAEAFQSAVDKIGRKEFENLTGLDDQRLSSVLVAGDEFVTVGVVTVACQINKSHGDTNPAHSSLTECLKGTTIRIPSGAAQPKSPSTESSRGRRRLKKIRAEAVPTGPLYDRRSSRVLGFVANIVGFLILGYFLGGIAISPILGESSCVGVTATPLGLNPCGGSLVGLVAGVIGGLGYTYYYFVKKL